MPRVFCKCGNDIDLSMIPSTNQLMMIEDEKYDKYFQGNLDAEYLYAEMMLVAKCEVCKRLYIFENGFANDPIIYQLEERKWNKK